MKIRKEYTCPLELVHDLLRGKWKAVIMWQLKHRERASLSQLRKDIKGISEKMLIEQLKELMEYEIIDKKVYEGYPLRVEYFLTSDKGMKLIKCLEIMQEVGNDYISEGKKFHK